MKYKVKESETVMKYKVGNILKEGTSHLWEVISADSGKYMLKLYKPLDSNCFKIGSEISMSQSIDSSVRWTLHGQVELEIATPTQQSTQPVEVNEANALMAFFAAKPGEWNGYNKWKKNNS